MKKVLFDERPSEKLFLSELVEKLQSGSKIVVFYRSNNSPTGVPVFLKMHGGKYWFESMMPSYQPAYVSSDMDIHSIDSLYYYLEKVMKSRKLFVSESDEIAAMFNQLEEE